MPPILASRQAPGMDLRRHFDRFFMTSLDNLVVTMALPNIRPHLHASLGGSSGRSAPTP